MGRHKQVSDDALLEAAREVFVEKGFGASTREIARRADVSESVLYQRYRTKLDLFYAAMIPPPIEQLATERGAAQPRSLAAELEILSSEILDYFRRAMPVFLQLVTQPSFDLAEVAASGPEMPLHRLDEAITACLERHRARGEITADGDRLRAATLTLLATLHSLALFERMRIHGGSFPDRAVHGVVALVVAGLVPEKGREG